MNAVLLVNMGTPASEKEMKLFLKRMFNDRAMIPAPALIRSLLSFIISNLRYKNSWKKYTVIGGSPLQTAMNRIQEEISVKLNGEYTVSYACSYSQPLISDEIEKLYHNGMDCITVIPVYPQASISTTGSINNNLLQLKKKYCRLNIHLVKEFGGHPAFINFWVHLIKNRIIELSFNSPYLLFSAHAIPEYHIKQGDSYSQSIEKSAMLISKALNLPFSICYQSKIGRIKWVGPDIKKHLQELKNKGSSEIIVIPVSFITENLETIYDLDTDIIPYAKNELGIKSVERVFIPQVHPLLIEIFLNLIKVGT